MMKSPLIRKRWLVVLPLLVITMLVTAAYKHPVKASNSTLTSTTLTPNNPPTPFLFGVCDPAGMITVVDPTEPNAGFQAMMDDIKRYGFNAVALNNGNANMLNQLLAISDASNDFRIILGPQSE